MKLTHGLLTLALFLTPPVSAQPDLFSEVKKSTFGYFWQGAEPQSGLARERPNALEETTLRAVVSSGSGERFFAEHPAPL